MCVRDLSTGEVFEQVPILRVLFCDGSTASLTPSDLWRGRSTVSSVLETVVHVLRDGIEQAHEWTLFGGTGESVVSRRTLRRWTDLVRTRLIGSAWAWLGPRLGLSWSDQADEAEQLDGVLDHLAGSVLLGFRAVTGCAVLDKPTAPVPRAGWVSPEGASGPTNYPTWLWPGAVEAGAKAPTRMSPTRSQAYCDPWALTVLLPPARRWPVPGSMIRKRPGA